MPVILISPNVLYYSVGHMEEKAQGNKLSKPSRGCLESFDLLEPQRPKEQQNYINLKDTRLLFYFK